MKSDVDMLEEVKERNTSSSTRWDELNRSRYLEGLEGGEEVVRRARTQYECDAHCAVCT